MKKILFIIVPVVLFYVMGVHPTPPKEPHWYAVALHTHSRHSFDAVLSIKSLLFAASLEGGDFVAITDHRDTKSFLDYDFKPQFGVTPIRGEEWGLTGIGHASVIGMGQDSDNPIQHGDGPGVYDALAEQAWERGALVYISHPFHSKTPWPSAWHKKMSGIEVWSAPWFFPTSKNQQATDWWQDLLAKEGMQITGVAVSDFHYPGVQFVMTPCVMVYAKDKTAPAVLDGLRKGHAIMAASPRSPKVYLVAEEPEDGSYYMIGDSISLQEKGRIKFKVQTTGSDSMDRVHVYTRQGRVDKLDLVPGLGRWESSFEMEFRPGEKNFVRVELRGSLLKWPHSMTNPIYINY